MKKELVYGVIFVIILWYVLYALQIINPLFLPTPHVVISELIRFLLTSAMWKDIGISLLRVFISLILAMVIGIPIGLLMGYYKKINSTFEIVVDFFRSLPALAVFPLLMLFFGIGDSSKIATTVFSCSMIIIINSMYGVIHSKKARQTLATMMDAGPLERLIRVTLPEALPQIFVGIRTGISFAVSIVIVTEMFIGTGGGIGHRIYDAALTYRIPEMYSSIIIAGLMGYLLNKGFIKIERKIIHWAGK